MEGLCLSSLSRFVVLLLFVCFLFDHKSQRVNATKPVFEIVKGFEAKPDSSIELFQPLLTDRSGNFSFGFLRVNGSRLSLAVTHWNLTDPLWVFVPTLSGSWSHKTTLFFNGSLVISDHSSRLEWSTDTNGDRLVLRNDSNLQVVKSSSSSVEWESFDFPGNTLVENQNFTSAMALVSSNGLYSMRLGNDFFGLYAKFSEDVQQFYWKHSALQAKAKVKDGAGPILARINPNGYLGMYQIGNTPIDVEAFNSFQRPVNGLLILRLENDGNLRGYLWDGSHWALNYEAIRETCDLPNPCGPYSLCTSGRACSCIDNATLIGECRVPPGPTDFCGKKTEFKVVRRGGVEVPFKELMDHKTTSSLEECEDMCVENCKCFGAVYNNGSGFCYLVNYPIQTMLGVSDPSKMGYFKLHEGVGKKKSKVGLTVWMSLLALVALVLTVVIVYVGFRRWSREKRVIEENGGLSPGPYKNIGSDSFSSVEMSRR